MDSVIAVQLGRQIAALRERAGLNQAELAQQVTVSQSVISRVEAGDRTLTADELAAILAAIGTEEARSLETRLGRGWAVLDEPGLDHPDQDDLWRAELALQSLSGVRDSDSMKPALVRRVAEVSAEIEDLAELVRDRSHQVAFIGTIGIGKSTAICRIANLEIDRAGTRTPVLEAGAGGITLCQVDVKVGPGYGLVVEPQSEGEIRAFVSDFVDSVLRSASTQPADDPATTATDRKSVV